MKYKLIRCQFYAYISDEVDKYLKDGWELHGSPFYAEGYVHQAMIFRG